MSRPARLRIVAFSAVDLSLPQGHALHLRELLDALADRGHEIVLLTPRPAGTRPSVKFGRIEIPALRWRVLTLWSFEMFAAIALFIRCLRRRPDLIFARHDLYTVGPAIVGWSLRVPLACQVNSSIPEELAVSGNRRARWLAEICERFHLRRAQRVLVLAEEHGRSLCERIRIDPERIAVTGIGSRLPESTDPRQTRGEFGIPPGTFLIGYAGNLAPIQGVDSLIRSVAEFSGEDLRLWIVGTGVDEVALKRAAASQGSRVRFFGGLPREEADRLMGACQILVAPYRREVYVRASGGGALSSKVVSYLAIDRPLVLTDLQSYRWVEQIGAGRLFDSSTPGGLADAIREFHSAWNAAGSPLFGWPWRSPGPGRRFVAEGHTWERVAERVESALAAIANASTRRAR